MCEVEAEVGALWVVGLEVWVWLLEGVGPELDVGALMREARDGAEVKWTGVAGNAAGADNGGRGREVGGAGPERESGRSWWMRWPMGLAMIAPSQLTAASCRGGTTTAPDNDQIWSGFVEGRGILGRRDEWPTKECFFAAVDLKVGRMTAAAVSSGSSEHTRRQ